MRNLLSMKSLEYWIVDPSNQLLDVFILENGKYVLKGKFAKDDKISVNTLPSLEIDLNDIFETEI